MRRARIKIEREEAVYHCMTRTVNGERIIDDVGKEVLRKQLWQISDYCGVQVITYTILSNHFHVLVRVPQKQPVPDAELLRRYSVLYPKPTRFQTTRLEVIQAQLETNGPEALAWRKSQEALMSDVSQFMKLLKQRFAIWFNKTHQRFGTLWAERFKSVLVEPGGRVIETMAAYIDLNCVRAGLARDPKEYRFCGYSEAVAGRISARNGLLYLFGSQAWNDAQSAYRQVLFGTGAEGDETAAGIALEEFRRVIDEGGKLPLSTVLRCRIRYFSDGAVLGSKAFVGAQMAGYRKTLRRRSTCSPRPLPAITDWGDLTTLRALRRQAFG